MPKLTISEKHALPQAEANVRIKDNVAAALKANTALVSEYSDDWVGENTMNFSFKILGFAIKGTTDSLPGEVKIEVSLPLAAVMLKGTIEAKMREEMKKVLGTS